MATIEHPYVVIPIDSGGKAVGPPRFAATKDAAGTVAQIMLRERGVQSGEAAFVFKAIQSFVVASVNYTKVDENP